MQINKLRLQTSQAVGYSSVSLPISGALPTDNYLLKDSEGLGPPDIDLYIDNTPGVGGYYQGRRVQLRQIVLTVGLNPNYGANLSVSDLRSALYWALSPENDNPALILSLMQDNTVVATTTVYVKSFVPNTFSKDPQIIITLESIDRFFKAPAAVNTLPVNVGGAYPLQVVNPGSATAGFHLKFTFTADATQFVITNQQSGKQMIVNAGFSNTDVLELNTVAGSRSISLFHLNQAPIPASTFNLLDQVDPLNGWLSLVRGTNNLSISAAGNLTAFDYIPRYWGI